MPSDPFRLTRKISSRGFLMVAAAALPGCAAYETYRSAPVVEREFFVSAADVIARVERAANVCWNEKRALAGDTIEIRRYDIGVGGTSLQIAPKVSKPGFASAFLTVRVVSSTASLSFVTIEEAQTVYPDSFRGFAPTVEGWIEGRLECGGRVPGRT